MAELAQGELENGDRQVLDELEVKIRIKTDQEKNIILPSWTMFLEGLKSVGREFARVEEMHDSNREIINMVNSKIVEDF